MDFKTKHKLNRYQAEVQILSTAELFRAIDYLTTGDEKDKADYVRELIDKTIGLDRFGLFLLDVTEPLSYFRRADGHIDSDYRLLLNCLYVESNKRHKQLVGI